MSLVRYLEKISESRKRYALKNKEKIGAYQHEYHKKHWHIKRIKDLPRQREWYQKNRQRQIERVKKYQASHNTYNPITKRLYYIRKKFKLDKDEFKTILEDLNRVN